MNARSCALDQPVEGRLNAFDITQWPPERGTQAPSAGDAAPSMNRFLEEGASGRTMGASTQAVT
jgi:hypothetical protein